MNETISWISGNYIELIAAALGLVAIILQIRQHILYWPVSIVLVSLYIYVYIHAKLYADMSLQVYYLGISFYGWYHWAFGKRNGTGEKLPVSFASLKVMMVSLVVAVVLFWTISAILIHYTDSDLPYWDAFTTALSFVATWMLARKIIENWLVWIVVDAVSVGIYIYKGLYPTAILFTVLTILAIAGYISWRKDAARQG
ncbi:MAG: nicotinamide riboside transporter PnuC [Bacteroidetes bacterium]|nr:nicotinamide riboside transporter PnuC [Bacteroidota bacterium]